jgi:SAM-dependent methyltransferase
VKIIQLKWSCSVKHAYATEYLLPFMRPGAKVLDVGSGSGYLCAVFHHIVSTPSATDGTSGPQGKVVGIEHVPELVEWSVKNLQKDGLGVALDNGAIKMVVGDGRQGTHPTTSLVGASGERLMTFDCGRISERWPVRCDPRRRRGTHAPAGACGSVGDAGADVHTRWESDASDLTGR